MTPDSFTAGFIQQPNETDQGFSTQAGSPSPNVVTLSRPCGRLGKGLPFAVSPRRPCSCDASHGHSQQRNNQHQFFHATALTSSVWAPMRLSADNRYPTVHGRRGPPSRSPGFLGATGIGWGCATDLFRDASAALTPTNTSVVSSKILRPRFLPLGSLARFMISRFGKKVEVPWSPRDLLVDNTQQRGTP